VGGDDGFPSRRVLPFEAGEGPDYGQDARAALSIARAAMQSVTTGSPVRIDELKDQ
jgi:myo-inositol 2-dehydrogenase/D-chiro-inositol 1-dehydrogenase